MLAYVSITLAGAVSAFSERFVLATNQVTTAMSSTLGV
jgi:hypothetical protein